MDKVGAFWRKILCHNEKHIEMFEYTAFMNTLAKCVEWPQPFCELIVYTSCVCARKSIDLINNLSYQILIERAVKYSKSDIKLYDEKNSSEDFH